MRNRAAIVFIAVLLSATSAAAQEASSWSSGTLSTPAQRPGEAKILKSDTARKQLKPGIAPSLGPAVAPPGTNDPKSTFTPATPGQDVARGTGSLATTSVPKTNAGTDPAYDAFDQGRYLSAHALALEADKRNEPQAATLLGRLYQDGLGVKPDPVLAAKWYRRAAELGDTEGTFAFAVMLAEGDGIQKNRAGAAQLFDTAAQRGHALANYNLALLFLKGDGKPENPHRAALHLRYAAEQGISQAQYDLATLYATGTGVEANATEAATWLAKAADQGLVDAEIEYGVWLFQGRGVAVSQWRGVQYFKSAADKGAAVAQNRLARCYATGTGAPIDLMEAAKWHMIAQTQGLTDDTLDKLLAKLSRADRSKAQRAAEEWLEQAALQ